MGKCTVHTVRFYVPEVRAIHCMARSLKSLYLALSRSDGTIEVWCMKNVPYLERVLHADSVESLAWSQNRLFSAGLHGTILEFNLQELNIRHTVPVIGGPVWCIAVDSTERILAAGTEEGYVNLLSIERVGLQPLKLLDKQEGRVLCLAWHPDGKQILTGSTDSLRLWDISTGRATCRMTLPRLTNKEETTVWFVDVTPEGEGVSGDSRGMVSFWDLKRGVQTQSIHTHKAPVLTVARSSTKMFCSGTDPIIAVLQKNHYDNRWFHYATRRIHDHDVRALSVFGQNLVSGGIDGHIAISNRNREDTCKFPPLEHDSIALCKARLILLRHLRHVEVWALGAKQLDPGRPELSDCKHLLSLESQHAEHIVCSAISADGAYIAYATPTTTRLVALSISLESVTVTGSWKVPCAGGAVALAFCPATNRLAVTSRGMRLHIFEQEGKTQLTTQLETFVRRYFKGTLGLLLFSPDGRHITVSDRNGTVVAFHTSNGEVAVKFSRARCIATALCYRNGALLVVFSDFTMSEWDLKTKLCTEFRSFMSNHLEVAEKRKPVTRLCWDETQPDRLLLVSGNNLYGMTFKDDKTETMGKKARNFGGQENEGKNSVENLLVMAEYKNLVFADWLSPEELVVVETTQSALERGLPPVLRKMNFGTK